MKEDNLQPSGRILKLRQILKRKTDEKHKLTGPALIQKITEAGYHTSDETLRKDLKALAQNGFPYVSTIGGKDPGYFSECEPFSQPELKLLLDSVQAARFVTEKKTKELTEKLMSLASEYQEQDLKKSEIIFNTRKHTNNQIYYIIDACDNALRNRTRLSFRYYDLDFRCKPCYRYKNKPITVEPFALICFEDNYYLHAFRADIEDEKEAMRTYRLDRMTKIELLSTPVTPRALARFGKAAEYTRSVFKMYGGEETEVTLRFPRELCGSVYDKFGEKTKITALSDDLGELTETIQISGTFFGWVDQFEGKMEIVSPAPLREKYKSHLQNLLEKYR